MRVAFVTTSDVTAIHDDVDFELHVAAFARVGIDLHHVAWEDESADWDSFDLVVLRSPWNYVQQLERFRIWLDRHRRNTRFHNPIELIEWNMEKRYLVDLAQRGVPIVPTFFVETLEEFRAALREIRSPELVVKPSISAGSRLTGRFRMGDRATEVLVGAILSQGLTVMVQPFAQRIDDEGELGTVVFDGQISHSFRKAALLDRDGMLVGGAYREEITSMPAPEDVRDVVTQALTAATAIARENGWIDTTKELLYGRYDVIRLDDGSPALLEAELFEPCFFLPTASNAADEFARVVARRVAESSGD